jgi:DegS peptidase. Serine peptidase. MEROPS family S01B
MLRTFIHQRYLIMLAKLLRSVAIGFIVGGILLAAMPSLRKWTTATTTLTSSDESPASYNQAVRRAAPAVVNVYNRGLNSTGQNQLEIRTLGSGVIMDERGYIVTNKHVINDADQIIVALQDGRVFEALLVGSDTLTDLAVLKINATGGLPVIPINPKRVPHIGDVVLAIGNPYNLGQTITQGIISATGRIGLNPTGRQNFLQTDASINHGNSGGALINSLGELMGIQHPLLR